MTANRRFDAQKIMACISAKDRVFIIGWIINKLAYLQKYCFLKLLFQTIGPIIYEIDVYVVPSQN